MSNTPYEEIKAFVGHSFSPEDKSLIAIFTDFFDTLKEHVNLNFVWTHAVNAEPKSVGEKVSQLIKGKNLFIGICTKKEFAINNKKIFSFLPDFLLRLSFQTRWKTSDWILQEIGLAIGSDMKLILLVEEGVDMCAGLQGDIEYIYFNRNSPTEVFNKIIQMLSALNPKKSQYSLEIPQEIPPKEKSEEERLKEQQSEKKSQSGDFSSYASIFYEKIFSKDLQGAQIIQQEYMDTNISSEEKAGWEAHCEYIYLEYTEASSLDKLRLIAKNHPINAEVLRYLGHGLATYKSYLESAKAFESASNVEVDPIRKISLLCLSAEMHQRHGDISMAREIIDKITLEVQKLGDGETLLLDALSKFSELQGSGNSENTEQLFAIMERKVAINPDDIHTRFSLAYKYSQEQRTSLALFHYLRIPEQKRDSSTWNNLGVTYQELSDLESKSVQAYKKAKDLDEPLAMNNLAMKYLENGFIEESNEECKKALLLEDCHPNILTTLHQIKTLPEKENKKEEEIVLSVNPVSRFYAKFGEALSCFQSNELPTSLNGPDCNLEFSWQDSKFEAIGTYEKRDRNALLGILAGRHEGATCSYHLKYSGIRKGCAIEGMVSHQKKDSLSIPSEAKVLMIISNDASIIEVMEFDVNNNFKFYVLSQSAINNA